MIQFSCRCGHNFELPIDAAGSSVQCPSCRLLNDVPMLSDFQTIANDGTYKLESRQVEPKGESVDDLLYVFAKTRVDADGNPIDLRNSAEDMSDVGAYETLDQSQRRQRPRYDPETGELVTPIPLAGREDKPVHPSEIPFARPAIVYANKGTFLPRVAGQVLLELIQPHSVIVMLFLLVVCLLGGLTGAVIIFRLYFFAPVMVVVGMAIIAHYGNVVNEIGVEERDELPRVLGDLRLYEDIWLPAASFATALILCYGPAIAVFFLAPLSSAAAAATGAGLALFGTYLFPATLLTLLTSGSISNLRPDRVLGVIHQSRKRYLGMVAVFFVGFAANAWGMGGVIIELMRMGLVAVPVPAWATSFGLALPLMLTGIFLMHYFCWHLGLYYRANHERFSWVGRVHVGEPRPPVVRRKPRYVVPPRAE